MHVRRCCICIISGEMQIPGPAKSTNSTTDFHKILQLVQMIILKVVVDE